MNLLPEWSSSRFPPGGFPYVDRKTGKNFDAMAGGLDDRVRQVQEHRRGNRHIYPNDIDLDAGGIRQEIINFMCTRRPELCGEAPAIAKQASPAQLMPTANCPSCGALDATPELCASCGGSRVKSWTCNRCSTKF